MWTLTPTDIRGTLRNENLKRDKNGTLFYYLESPSLGLALSLSSHPPICLSLFSSLSVSVFPAGKRNMEGEATNVRVAFRVDFKTWLSDTYGPFISRLGDADSQLMASDIPES